MFFRLVMISRIRRLLLSFPWIGRLKSRMSTQLGHVRGTQFRESNGTLTLSTRLHALKLAIVTCPRLARILRVIRVRPRRVTRSVKVGRNVHPFTRNVFNVTLRRSRLFRPLRRRLNKGLMRLRVKGTQTGHFGELRVRNILSFMGNALT